MDVLAHKIICNLNISEYNKFPHSLIPIEQVGGRWLFARVDFNWSNLDKV